MTRVVLVTGANRGIGQELARQLVLRGDTVVLTARDLAKAERTAATLPDPQPSASVQPGAGCRARPVHQVGSGRNGAAGRPVASVSNR
jgi:NAD(P)-dependent dehydrogenase (short-subunit alcohol dehydrogenase family)